MREIQFAGNPTFLVTGGGGFIGSHIAETLVGMGHTVRVLDDFSTGHMSNIPPGCDVIEGSITDLEVVRSAVDGIDYILHQAAIPSVPRSVKDPLASHNANVDGTLNLLLAARDAKVRRLVYASSSSVYGDTPTLPKVETMPPRPKSPYALQKLTAEEYCRIFFDVYGLETVSLRYFNVFGPRQDPKSYYTGVIAKFATALLTGQTPTIFGDGFHSRDFTFVSNNVRANLLACTAPASAAGQTTNVACGDRITLRQLLDSIQEILGTGVQPEYGPEREGDVRDSQADINKARELIGYEPAVGFIDGLRTTMEWYRKTLA